MKAVAFNGSPRKNGNTHMMLETVLGELKSAGWETELVQVGGRLLRGCLACGSCFKNKNQRCVTEDDPINEWIAKMIQADAIILGSPTYYANLSSEIKALIDRAGFVCMANGNLLAGKIGAAVAVARRGGAIHVFDSLNHLFSISRMIVPGSTYWNMGYGLEPGDVAKDDEGLNNMRHLGKTIAWLGKCTVPARDSYPQG